MMTTEGAGLTPDRWRAGEMSDISPGDCEHTVSQAQAPYLARYEYIRDIAVYKDRVGWLGMLAGTSAVPGR
jgi:hypothetical protein